jgi:hypothetical protein
MGDHLSTPQTLCFPSFTPSPMRCATTAGYTASPTLTAPHLQYFPIPSLARTSDVDSPRRLQTQHFPHTHITTSPHECDYDTHKLLSQNERQIGLAASLILARRFLEAHQQELMDGTITEIAGMMNCAALRVCHSFPLLIPKLCQTLQLPGILTLTYSLAFCHQIHDQFQV